MEMLSVQSAVAQVRLQTLAESATATFAEHSAVAYAFGNSTTVALWERLAVARSEGQVLGASMVHLCGENAAFAKLKLQVLGTSMVRLCGENAAVAKLKLQTLGESALQMGGEHAAWAQASIQDLAKIIVQQFRERSVVLSKYIEEVPLSEMPGKLYVASLSSLKGLKASVISASTHFIDEAPAYASNFTRSCRTTMASMKESSSHWGTPLQLVGGIVLSFIALIVIYEATDRLLRLVRAVCCRRRGAAAARVATTGDARSEIMMAPSPLRERSARLPQVPQRRRRSESPGAVAKENAAGASENVVSEEDVLIRLNTATEDELRLMPGLGDKSINKIVQYRNKAGGLESVGDLVSKVGIHGATFANFAKAQGI